MGFVPKEIDEYFLLDAILVFLMINYNMPLGTIYLAMALLGSLMYYVAADQGLFKPIPFTKNGIKLIPVGIGIAFGIGFIFLYNYLSTAPIAGVFATTAFGESEQLGKIVYGLLIPITETKFFFRTIMQWYAWKAGLSVREAFSFVGLQLMAIFGAIFTLFHATAFGLANNQELIAAFAFGALSVGMVLYFQEVIHAIVAHIIVNGHSVGLFDWAFGFFKSGALFANPFVLIGVAAGAYFLFIKPKRRGTSLRL